MTGSAFKVRSVVEQLAVALQGEGSGERDRCAVGRENRAVRIPEKVRTSQADVKVLVPK